MKVLLDICIWDNTRADLEQTEQDVMNEECSCLLKQLIDLPWHSTLDVGSLKLRCYS